MVPDMLYWIKVRATCRPIQDDNKKELLERVKVEDTKLTDNNNFYTSTPLRTANGNVSELSLTSNGNYSTTNTLNGDDSPSKVLAKEQLMNSINANTLINAKEILMTELTYKKDLDVINVWFRDEIGREEPEECQILLSLIAPLAQAHGLLVKDLEKRLKGWDIKGGPRAIPSAEKIADVLLAHLPPLLPIYEEYLDGHMLVLERLDTAFKQNNRFEQLYRDFETQKVCYLPLTTFVLKPLHRLLQYQALLQRLLKHYGPSHPDRADCMTASDTLKDLMQPVTETLEQSKNLATLCELQRDIIGFDNLVQPGRKFIRHGCLLKHSRKGYQQRMFFLFSDILLYTSRSQATLQFKVHGHMPLRGVLIEEPDGDLMFNGLIIYGGNRALTVAANSPEEKEKWKNDLQSTIQLARDKSDTKITYLSLKSCSSSDEHLDQIGNNDVGTQTKPQTQRNNTTVHVCWHRSTSISMKDELLAVENQLSGYLLRKFKSSNGWQKLWVVFTSFCLFFYKGCTDDFPLASLPLLGYSVGPPLPEDQIVKDYVFKLQYKNHLYFFRAESEYTYNRWMEVIGSATQSRRRKILPVNDNKIETSS
ncbi:FERM, ARHGEF and pleckstrin domain-containing protein 2-like [Diorhabda sublineata]|uniref:FERM, ARHGEF and pleckstrin domain-containing protein 2-like n=1 Tax=Diorhabda sublineata TaxID=1163346 RepID=UPI0024E09B02|nr:FERM, ARHGEF and pleckstrin domain-containing protein 2-like [Diorhabda sublineata]